MAKKTDNLMYAARRGDAQGVALFLKKATRLQAIDALHAATIGGHAECVEMLIPLSQPKAQNSRALELAAQYGHAECVKVLIPVSDPTAQQSYPLQVAASLGHVDCVKLLIPVSDPAGFDSAALTWAARRGHRACVEALLPFNPPSALAQAARLAREHAEHALAAMIEAFNEKRELAQISTPAKTAKSKTL